MKKTALVLAVVLAFVPLLYAQDETGGDGSNLVTFVEADSLAGLITGLYGGDGIQLDPTFGHDAHFGETEDFQQFSQVLQGVIQSRTLFPTPSAVGVVSYAFNEETGTYEKVEGALGPLIAERGTTSGKGRLNIAVNYAYTEFSDLNGSDDIVLTLEHCQDPSCFFGGDPNHPVFDDVIEVTLNFTLRSQAIITSIVYGLTDNVDVGLVLPYLRNDLTVSTDAQIVRQPGSIPGTHRFNPLIETARQYGSQHATGIGDMIVRAKFRVPSLKWADVAFLADAKVPSGEEADFLGTGDMTVRGTLIASKLGSRFNPHVNVGYELNLDDTDFSYLDYRMGTEVFVSSRLTLATDLAGSYRPTVPSEFNARALDEDLVGKSEIDGTLGAKWKLTDRAVFLANLIVPLNDTGIRPSNLISVGVQWGL